MYFHKCLTFFYTFSNAFCIITEDWTTLILFSLLFLIVAHTCVPQFHFDCKLFGYPEIVAVPRISIMCVSIIFIQDFINCSRQAPDTSPPTMKLLYITTPATYDLFYSSVSLYMHHDVFILSPHCQTCRLCLLASRENASFFFF